MKFNFPIKLTEIQTSISNPLFKNSFFNMLSRVCDVSFGFIFWLLASKLYSISDVGLATAMISSIGIIMFLSRLGFDVSQIRYLKQYHQEAIFNTCLWIPAIFAVFVSIVYISCIDIISPPISFIKNYALFFIIIAFFNSIILTTGNAFMSFRKSEYRFLQNLILGGRIIFLYFFVFLGSIGILFSFGIAYFSASIFAFLLIQKFVLVKFNINKQFIKETIGFSFKNYIASALQQIPVLILPILILNVSEPSIAALFFIAYSIGNIVMIIPDAISWSFLVEGSHGIDLRYGVKKALKVTYLIMIPAIILFCFCGNILLGFFGKNYQDGYSLLVIILISTLFVAVYQIFMVLQTIRMNVEHVILINLIRGTVLLLFSFIFLKLFGLLGLGFAWMLTYIIIVFFILLYVLKNKWGKFSLNTNIFQY